MDMNPQRPKAIWGFNGTERPGAVYLAAALAGHTAHESGVFLNELFQILDTRDNWKTHTNVRVYVNDHAVAGLAAARSTEERYA